MNGQPRLFESLERLVFGSRDPRPKQAEMQDWALLAAAAIGVLYVISSSNWARMHWWNSAFVFAGVVVAWAVFRRIAGAGWAVLVYVTSVGILDRLVRPTFRESDVLAATNEAIRTLGAGENPYTHYYLSTVPAGHPFPYPPGEIFFYAIPRALFGQITEADRWAGIGIVLLLASLAFLVGTPRASLVTAIYATFGFAAILSMDGSNDTSFAFLVVLAIVLLAWSEKGRSGDKVTFFASAVAFSWALLFKQFAWLIYPFVLLYLVRTGRDWRRYGLVTLVPFAILMLFFGLQDPAGFFVNVVAGTTHPDIFGLNIWSGLLPVAPSLVHALNPWITLLGFGAIAVVAVILVFHPAFDLGTAVLQGLAVLFVALFFARWTAAPYYAGAAAVAAAGIGLLGVGGRFPVRAPDPGMASAVWDADERETLPRAS